MKPRLGHSELLWADGENRLWFEGEMPNWLLLMLQKFLMGRPSKEEEWQQHLQTMSKAPYRRSTITEQV